MKDVLDRQRTLDLPALSALIDGSVLAIRVANYADAQVCVEMTRRMLASPLYGKYENAPKIGRIGKALFETIDSVNAALGYLAGAPGWMEEMRMECAPYLSPIDRLRLEADILWPGGARVARLQGRPMFAGLLRVFEEGSEAEPHQDHLDWDVGPLGMHEGAYLETQLAANVYLEVPPSGGELVIWPSGLSREAYERYRNAGSYGVNEAVLRGDPLLIQPRRGDLILFNSRNTHAVRSPIGGKRISWSCFIGCNGAAQPLGFWS